MTLPHGRSFENEVGTSPPRGRPRLDERPVERWLSTRLRRKVRLGPRIVVTGGPETCPACGSRNVAWGCAEEVTQTREEIHPLVWHDEAWMADSYICRDCHAGWIEPDEPEAITWVRPYWRVHLPDSAT
jgi:hypothetical protein